MTYEAHFLDGPFAGRVIRYDVYSPSIQLTEERAASAAGAQRWERGSTAFYREVDFRVDWRSTHVYYREAPALEPRRSSVTLTHQDLDRAARDAGVAWGFGPDGAFRLTRLKEPGATEQLAHVVAERQSWCKSPTYCVPGRALAVYDGPDCLREGLEWQGRGTAQEWIERLREIRPETGPVQTATAAVHPRLVAIYGGGDWADASVEHLLVPADMDLERERTAYIDRDRSLDRERASHPGGCFSFSAWLKRRGATDAEVEGFEEP